jgi:raffinose/stachyose/melibiose transport system permease protein
VDKIHKRLYPTVLCAPALILYGLFFVVPVAAAFFLSFSDWNIQRLMAPKLAGFSNFTALLRDKYFVLALENTVTFAIVTTFFIVAIGIAMSVLLTMPLWGQNFFRTLFYMPAVLSLIVIGLMFTAVFKMDGLFNQTLGFFGMNDVPIDWLGDAKTALGVTIFAHIWKWVGFAMAIFIAGIQGISADYYEAADIDGANGWQQFTHVTFPLIAPAFTVAFTMNLIGSFKVFEQVYVMTNGGPGNASQVLGTYIYKTFSQGMLGRSTAMGLMLFLLITLVSTQLTKLLRRREESLT